MPYCFDYSTGNNYYINEKEIDNLKRFIYSNWKDRNIIEAKMKDGKPSKDAKSLNAFKKSGKLELTEEQIDKVKPWIDNSILVGVRGDSGDGTKGPFADYSQPVFWTDKIPGQTKRSDTTKPLLGDWVTTEKWGKGDGEEGRIYKINEDGTYYIDYYLNGRQLAGHENNVKSEEIDQATLDKSKKIENEKGGSFWTFEDNPIKRALGSIWINVTPILSTTTHSHGEPYVADGEGRQKTAGKFRGLRDPYCERDKTSQCGTYLFKWAPNVGDSAYRAVMIREGEKGGGKRTNKRKMNKRKKTRRNKNKRKTVKKIKN